MRFHVFASVCVQYGLPARRCVGAYKIFIDYSTSTLQESFYSRFAVARITDDKNNPKTPRRDFRVCRVAVVVVVMIIINRRRVDSRRTRTPSEPVRSSCDPVRNGNSFFAANHRTSRPVPRPDPVIPIGFRKRSDFGPPISRHSANSMNYSHTRGFSTFRIPASQ